MGGMLMMVSRDYTQVVAADVTWNKAGFWEDEGKTVCTQTCFSHERILGQTEFIQVEAVTPGPSLYLFQLLLLSCTTSLVYYRGRKYHLTTC